MTHPLNCAEPIYGPAIPLDIAPIDARIATGEGVDIAVIDTGSANPGTSGDRSSCILHGTAVASVVHKIAPNAPIHALRHSPNEDRAEGTVGDLVQAINAARDSHAKIINISMVACEDVAELRDTIASAQQAGALVVASVGNRGQCDDSGTPFPAAIDAVLSVGAVDSLDSAGPDGSLNAGRIVADYSAPSAKADIYAPGGPVSAELETDGVVRTVVGGPDPFLGTSFAAPMVTGTAALVWDIAPFLSATEVAEILLSTSIPGGAEPGGNRPIQVLNPQMAMELAWHKNDAAMGHEIMPNAQASSALAKTRTVSSLPVSEAQTDYRVPIALSVVVALVLVVALIARALSSDNKPASGS